MATPVSFPGIDAARTGLLVVFSGDVLKQFREKAVMLGTHIEKTISSGKSAQFPVMGRAQGIYHKPGEDVLTDLTPGAVTTAQRLISIDRTIVAPIFVDQLESALAHWGDRQMYSMEAADALARVFDSHAIRTGFQTAWSTATLTSGTNPPQGGGNLQDTDFETNGASAAATIFRLAEEMDKRDLPKMDRMIVVRPNTFYRLVQQSELITKDTNPPNGSLAEGEIIRVAGIRIIESTNLPTGSFRAGSDLDAPGAGATDTTKVFNFSGSYDPANPPYTNGPTTWDEVHALGFHRSAFGTLKAMDITTEASYLIFRQGWLLIAKYAMGHGVLRPEAALSVSDAADALPVT